MILLNRSGSVIYICCAGLPSHASDTHGNAWFIVGRLEERRFALQYAPGSEVPIWNKISFGWAC